VARLLLGTTVFAVIASCAASSAAEHASVSLTYTRQDSAASCPDEATFRGLVAARLGYDPFVASGALALTVDFERRGNEVVGRLNLTGKNDEKRGQRTLRAGADDCFELATSMALVAAVAVDPDAVQARKSAESPVEKPSPPEKPAPPVEPAPRPNPQPARPPPAPPTTPAVDRFEHGVRLSLGGVLPVGIVPAPRGGVRAGAAVDVGAWSIGAEGAFLFPSSRDNPSGDGEITARVLSGSLVPCAHPFAAETWMLEFCFVGSFGALRSTASDVSRAEPATDLFATVGPRAAVVVMFSRVIGVSASADVPVTLSRVHLHIEDRGQRHEVWAQNPVGFIGGLSLVVRVK
jgi:hypothetical protein